MSKQTRHAFDVFISYKRNQEPDEPLALRLRAALQDAGHNVFIDQMLPVGVKWARELERQIQACDFMLVLLSEASVYSEMVAKEVELAHKNQQRAGKSRLLPVRVNYADALPYPVSHYLDPLQHAQWRSDADDERLIRQLLDAISDFNPLPPSEHPPSLALTLAPRPYADPRFIESLREPSGAVGRRSEFYIEREGDQRLARELAKPYGTTTTIRAPRQTGKSSLLIRGLAATVQGTIPSYGESSVTGNEADLKAELQGLELALDELTIEHDKGMVDLGRYLRLKQDYETRKIKLEELDNLARDQCTHERLPAQGSKVVLVDLQLAEDKCLQSLDDFLHYLALVIVAKLGLDPAEVEKAWRSPLGAPDKTTYLLERYVLPQAGDAKIVLALDEADRLLRTDFHDTFFGVTRFWHNSRAMNELWEKLDIVMVISTEPHLLIGDVTQSPFNVGTRIRLQDFDAAQVDELNRRYRSPLDERQVAALFKLLNGHPYLTHKALYVLLTEGLDWDKLTHIASDEKSPFGDHLRRYLWLLRDQPQLRQALKQVISQQRCADQALYYRLLQAGLIKGPNKEACTCRCKLYQVYFEEKL